MFMICLDWINNKVKIDVSLLKIWFKLCRAGGRPGGKELGKNHGYVEMMTG